MPGHRSEYLRLLTFIGILFAITITCSGGETLVNRLKAGEHESTFQKQQIHVSFNENSTALRTKALEKTSSKCKGKSMKSCREGMKKVGKLRNRTEGKGKVAVAFQSRQLQLQLPQAHHNSVSYDKSEYLPVPYGPNGYEDVSEARSWLAIPLFFIFSIIQFKIMAAIFLALFGPLILFIFIVQAFFVKLTLVLMGLMIM
ncbi:unnamed protein product [Orchesella dallaii]|uniref:Uncharacterized protein n=1 Tax=Orchesella dallaii TaxID=48710 RepID=A0ABP1PYL3_9HEXA